MRHSTDPSACLQMVQRCVLRHGGAIRLALDQRQRCCNSRKSWLQLASPASPAGNSCRSMAERGWSPCGVTSANMQQNIDSMFRHSSGIPSKGESISLLPTLVFLTNNGKSLPQSHLCPTAAPLSGGLNTTVYAFRAYTGNSWCPNADGPISASCGATANDEKLETYGVLLLAP